MDNYLSVKLKVISFFLIVMVIYRHSHDLLLSVNTGNIEIKEEYLSFFQDFIFNGINRVPSSLFFLISGYLFFLNYQGHAYEFVSKFIKRLRTLVVPYLIWSLWGILLCYILQLIPYSHNFFSKGIIKDYSIGKLLNTIFIDPIPYQLWFLKDLFVLTCIAPLIYFLIRYLKIYLVLILLIVWFYGFDFKIFYDRSLLFFIIGAYLSKKDLLIQTDLSRQSLIFIGIWIAITLCITSLEYNRFQNEISLMLLDKVATLTGVVAIWSLYDKLFKGKDLSSYKHFKIFSFTFFLFVFHEPILTIFKRGLSFFLGKGEFASFLIYLCAPLLTITLGILTGNILEQIAPNFYSIITGGRQKRLPN